MNIIETLWIGILIGSIIWIPLTAIITCRIVKVKMPSERLELIQRQQMKAEWLAKTAVDLSVITHISSEEAMRVLKQAGDL